MAQALLNPAQNQAVEHQTGPLLVLAGAGSGKTRVITHRIARLIERGVPAQSIIALTFTNKAAAEMRERVTTVLRETGGDKRRGGLPITICTFHAFGLQVLTKERQALGGAFTIFDQGDALGAIKELLRHVKRGKNYDAQAILARISAAKNAFVGADDLPDSDDEYDEITKLIYPRYRSALKQFRAFDFDDLVCEVARMWGERGDLLSRWQERFRFVLVDEYQDTNRAQLHMLKLLAGEHRNICVVGDDDQSIYAWRGADVRNILEFEEHFPGGTVVKLEQNYRSCAQILDVANAVISKRNDAKYRKTLFTMRLGGQPVEVIVAPTPDVEANFVAHEMRRLMRDEAVRPKQMAVLYRSNSQAKLIEEVLRGEAIPHRVIGGQQFFERKEVKDLLSYLKLTINPNDEISLRRIINYPARGIGETSVERLALHALARGWTLWQAVERVDAIDEIPNAAREGCHQLEKIVMQTRRDLESAQKPANEAVRSLAERIQLRSDLEASSGSLQVAARRWGNIEGLIRTFARRDERLAAGKEAETRGLSGFIQALTLNFDEEETASDAATLSTLHGAKGLEFKVVFLIGCEEGLLPHSRTLDTRATDAAPQDIEEERRLFYVGITRAQSRLYLSRAKTRASRGKAVARTPSRFLMEIPANLIEEREVKAGAAMSSESLEEQANALLAALNAL